MSTQKRGVSGPPKDPSDPRVRQEITSYLDVSALVDRLGLRQPIRIYDAALPEDDGFYSHEIAGAAYPYTDRHCVYVDLETLHDWEHQSRRSLPGQLPRDVPWTFENLLRADIAHEMSHLRQTREQIEFDATIQDLFGYEASEEEARARTCGRELYSLVKVINPQALSV